MPDWLTPSDWFTPDTTYVGGLAVLLLLLAIEHVRYPARFALRDTLTNLFLYAGYVVVGALWLGMLYAIYRWAWDHRLFDLGPYWLDPAHPRFWMTWGALLVLEDLCFYWFHRASHRWPLYWASHVTHHSSPFFNYSTALRQSRPGARRPTAPCRWPRTWPAAAAPPRPPRSSASSAVD